MELISGLATQNSESLGKSFNLFKRVSVFIYKVKMILVSTLWGCFEDEIRKCK